MKSIKTKILSVYIFLISLIFLVAIVSIYNLYSLSKAVDGLIAANYKSIVAARNMLDALERQDSYELLYIQVGDNSNIKSLYENQKEFINWMTKANDNITERKEHEITTSISENYMKYMELTAQLRQMKESGDESDASIFYNEKIYPTLLSIKEACEELLELNETAMFNSKNAARLESMNLMYVMIIISLLCVFLGFAVAWTFTGKIVKPIYNLISKIKSVKEGQLQQEISIETKDEIGELTVEFNNMTKRLLLYEKSNIKKLILEKNKSLAIVKSISDPVVVTDNNHKIVLLNRAAEVIFGVSEANVIGKHFLESINNRAIFNRIRNTLRGIQENKADNIVKFEDTDTTRYYFLTAAAIYDNENYATGSVTVLKDITTLKEMENMKTEFVTTISHEIRTPLTSVIMGIDLLSGDTTGNLNEEQKEIVFAMEEDSKQLMVLIDDLLDLSKIESGKVQMNFENVLLQNIIKHSMKVFKDIAESRDIKLCSNIPENLPYVRIDTNKIIRVLNNLVTNALKFNEPGGQIDITAFDEGKSVRVVVSDTGKGIPEEHQKAIFERFVQIEQASTEGRGAGLGLAISKEYIKKHGGDIWVESTIGKGSKFIFTLPVYR